MKIEKKYNIAFRDLKKQYINLKPAIDERIARVLEKGNFIMGEEVSMLEEQLAKEVGVKHCLTCANGTDALSLVLMTWEITKGDLVFIPDFTFFATAEVVALQGATPVMIDIDPNTFNMDPIQLETAIQRSIKAGQLRPKAIITVDLFGLPAEYTAIEKIAEKYGLYLLEDGAQGFGGRIGERKACSFGDAATTSFFPAKPLGGYGDGGAIFTNDDYWAEMIRSLRIHGKGVDKYDNIRIGLNSRLDTLQAAILIEKLKAFQNYELQAVNKVAEHYSECLKANVKVPYIPKGYYSSWAQYTIQVKNKEQRKQLIEHLEEAGIPTQIYYPKPLHLQEAFKGLGYEQGTLEITEKICERVIALPMHPYLEEEEIKYICNKVNDYYQIGGTI